MRETKQKIVVICGPTASGKTELALQLAKDLPRVNLLSVDSRQAYQGLDIVTGKDIPQDLSSNISIFGHDIFKPEDRANLADFVRYSQKIISISVKDNIPLIIVGGTGLYLKAITENLSNVLIPPDEKLRRQLEKLSLEDLQTKLKKIDNKKYSSLNRSDFMNPRRLIRYIEISSSVSKENKLITQTPNSEYLWFGILPDKSTLKKNIRQRVLQRLKSGAVYEVSKLLIRYPNRNLPIYSSLGVSQIIDFLDAKIDHNQLIDSWTNAEVDYARRQIVWFKKQPGIVWYDKDIDSKKIVKELSKTYLQNA